MFPSSSDFADEWLYADSLPSPTPWDELQYLAKQAGVSAEELSQTVELATDCILHGKATPDATDTNDLEAVVRALSDDEFSLETKAQWHEADHPRDKIGRFTDGGTGRGGAREAGNSMYLKEPLPHERQQFTKEMENVHEAIQQILGRNSRWGGRTFVIPSGLIRGAAGMKRWICDILIGYNPGMVKNKEQRLCTMIHEALHALSPTTENQYNEFPGWEEATIEWVVRLQRNAVAQRLNLNVSQANFDARDQKHGYKELVQHLERIRQSLYAQTKSPAHEQQAFYNHLITLDIPGRKKYLIAQLNSLPTPEREKFWEVLNYNANALNKYQQPDITNLTTTPMKSQTLPMTRDELLALMLSCQTPEAIRNAQWELYVWMKQHPDDSGVQDGSEMMYLRADSLGMEWPDILGFQRRYYALYPLAPRDENDIPENPAAIAHYKLLHLFLSAHSKEDVVALQEALEKYIRDYPDNEHNSSLTEMVEGISSAYGVKSPNTDSKI